MEDWKSKVEQWEEEARILWGQWGIEPKNEGSFHNLICTCYLLKMLLEYLIDFQSKIKNQLQSLRISFLIRLLINGIRRLTDSIRGLVPNITDKEFEEGFKSVINSLDTAAESLPFDE